VLADGPQPPLNQHGTRCRPADGLSGYYNRIPKSCGFLPEQLVPQGYAAYAIGKWHLTPEDEYHNGASRARWPLGRGFERYYGFFGGETNQFAPSLIEDNHVVAQPRAWDDGYHLTEDLADHAIQYLKDLRAATESHSSFCLLQARLPLAAPAAARVDRALPRGASAGLDAGARRRSRASAR
jgi:arylsulfatase